MSNTIWYIAIGIYLATTPMMMLDWWEMRDSGGWGPAIGEGRLIGALGNTVALGLLWLLLWWLS